MSREDYSPLCVVGQLNVPGAVLKHRFVREVQAVVRVLEGDGDEDGPGDRVAGTANTGEVELYGWGRHVGEHVDNSGFIYFSALTEGESVVHACGSSRAEVVSVLLPVGAVVRLNDYHLHWTEDQAARVCAFVGAYRVPTDAEAVAKLQVGVDALARGDYYGAPRCSPGFRVLRADECLVPNEAWSECAPMLLADAQARGEHYETCAHCDRPAIRIDNHWPYFSDGNYCRNHSPARQR